MSGGHFDYQDFQLRSIADDIEREIEKSGQPLTQEELKENSWRDSQWYEKYPEDLFHYKYPDEVIEKFKEAVIILRKAYIYAHRIDYLLSGDDGEKSFIERLNEELTELKQKHETGID